MVKVEKGGGTSKKTMPLNSTTVKGASQIGYEGDVSEARGGHHGESQWKP